MNPIQSRSARVNASPPRDPRRRRSAVAAVAAGLLALTAPLAGCGGSSSNSGADSGSGTVKEYSPPGDIPDDQVFVNYTDASGRVSIKVPEGWAQSGTANGVSFTDKLNTIQLEVLDATGQPTEDTVKNDDLPQLRNSLSNFSGGEVSSVDRAGTNAILATFEADGPKDEVTGKTVTDAFERYVYFKHGVEAVLTLSGPTGADNVDPWRLVSDSVRWK
jgi:hypothetical protein